MQKNDHINVTYYVQIVQWLTCHSHFPENEPSFIYIIYRWASVVVQLVQQEVQAQAPLDGAHQASHRRETVRMSKMFQAIFAFRLVYFFSYKVRLG